MLPISALCLNLTYGSSLYILSTFQVLAVLTVRGEVLETISVSAMDGSNLSYFSFLVKTKYNSSLFYQSFQS